MVGNDRAEDTARGANVGVLGVSPVVCTKVMTSGLCDKQGLRRSGSRLQAGQNAGQLLHVFGRKSHYRRIFHFFTSHPVKDFRFPSTCFFVRFLQVMQSVENQCIGEDAGCRVRLLPTAICARRELQTLNVQGLADLLDRVATLALPIDELGD